jgi:hypothetical protein
LVELMVALFVSAILLTVLSKMFSLSFRVGHEELARSNAETVLTTLVRDLESDLQSTTSSGLSLSADGSRTVIHPMGQVTPRRQVLYPDRLLYWSFDSGQETVFKSEYLTSPGRAFDTLPLRLETAELTALPLAGSDRVVRRFPHITRFAVLNPTDVIVPSVGSPLRVEVTVRLEPATTRQQVDMVRQVRLRTSGH